MSGGLTVSGGLGGNEESVVRHRRYVGYDRAHYGGGLVDGAYVLALFGDVATEVAIREGADEGLLAGYSSITFHAPVLAGDIVEVSAQIVRRGRRSRLLALTAQVHARSEPGRGPSAARLLDPPLLVTSATATLVLPAPDSAPGAPPDLQR